MHRRLAALLTLGTPLLFADVTLRYNVDLKMGIELPAGTPVSGPTASEIRIKGDKTRSTMGKFTVIGDLASNQMTWIDTENMRIATATGEEFVKALANVSSTAMPTPPQPAQDAAGLMRGDVQTRKTGRTETIQGIRAEETEVVYALNIGAAPANVPAGTPLFRLTLQFWRANADDVARNPALAELVRYGAASSGLSGSDLSNFVRRLSGSMPGFDRLLRGFQDALDGLVKAPGVTLRTRMEESSPLLAAGAPAAGAIRDPTAPLFSMTNELVELSTAPIDDSMFQIPEGYRKVELEEMLKEQFAAARAQAR